MPVRARTSDDLPWSTWPAVATTRMPAAWHATVATGTAHLTDQIVDSTVCARRDRRSPWSGRPERVHLALSPARQPPARTRCSEPPSATQVADVLVGMTRQQVELPPAGARGGRASSSSSKSDASARLHRAHPARRRRRVRRRPGGDAAADRRRARRPTASPPSTSSRPPAPSCATSAGCRPPPSAGSVGC